MSTNTTKSSTPSPPSFSYTPASLTAAANSLIANSVKVWDHVATIPPGEATFSTAIQPLIDDENARSAQGRLLYFLSTVSPDKDIRAAGKKADVALKHDVIQRFARADVFAVVDAVAQRPDTSLMSAGAQVYLRKVREEFVRNGLAIKDPKDRARLRDVNLRLAEVQAQFSANLNGDVSGIWLTAQELGGLAPAVLERFERRDDGKYFVTFKRPNINAVLGEVDSARVRRQFYVAWDNRLRDSNGPLLLESLRLRREAGVLLGFRNFAEMMDGQRMLTAERVKLFLDSVRQPLIDIAEGEIGALSAIKAAHINTLTPEQKDESSTEAIFRWDTAYYKRLAKLQSTKTDVGKVAEYFSFQLLLPRLLEVYSLLFGLKFLSLATGNDHVDVWHEDVKVWSVWNDAGEGGDFVGYLYVDPYPRDGKYGHVGTYCIQLVSNETPSACETASRDCICMRTLTFRALPRATSNQMAQDSTLQRR